MTNIAASLVKDGLEEALYKQVTLAFKTQDPSSEDWQIIASTPAQQLSMTSADFAMVSRTYRTECRSSQLERFSFTRVLQ